MRNVWVLNDLFVSPAARGHGVATSLMQAATSFAKESGAARMTLATAMDNVPAQALYDKLGWKRDETFVHFLYKV